MEPAPTDTVFGCGHRCVCLVELPRKVKMHIMEGIVIGHWALICDDCMIDSMIGFNPLKYYGKWEKVKETYKKS